MAPLTRLRLVHATFTSAELREEARERGLLRLAARDPGRFWEIAEAFAEIGVLAAASRRDAWPPFDGFAVRMTVVFKRAGALRLYFAQGA